MVERARKIEHRTRLEVYPRSAPVVAGYDPVRRATLRRFPLADFHQPRDEDLEVLRVLHTARDPEGWQG